MAEIIKTDVVVAGAGPAGCTASLVLSKNNIDHFLIEKDLHPRDKVCGDALSGKVFSVLKRINPDYISEINSQKDFYTPSWGVTFFAPNGKGIDIPFNKNKTGDFAPGYIAKRIYFDNFLFSKAREGKATVYTESQVREIKRNNTELEIIIEKNEKEIKIITKLIIAADGERSVVRKELHGEKKNMNHFSAGIRAYYTGVADLHPENFIELHYVDEVIPGYFWIFPLPNGAANVGIGMLSKDVSRKKVNLKLLLEKIITEKFHDRFSDAKIQGDVKGWGLPLAMKKNNLSGNNYMLTGDAASLIDPFTGEGISNAMISGYKAAEQAILCLKENNFSAAFIKQYDHSVYNRLGKELKLSKTLQQLVNYPWLFNFVVNKARKNKTLQETLSAMFDDIDLRKKLKNPAFYSKLIFNY